MLVGRHLQLELLKDLRDVRFDGSFAQEDSFGNGGIAQTFGDEGQHLLLSWSECRKWALAALTPDHARNNRGIDDGVAVDDPLEGVDKDCDVEDAFFEKVSDLFGLVFYQPHRIARFYVLREDEDSDLRMIVPNSRSGDEAFVSVARRHANVDDGNVGLFGGDLTYQSDGVAGLGNDVDARLSE